MKSSPSAAADLQQAMSDLRAAVSAVSSSGQMEGRKGEELNKRVGEPAKHLSEKSGADAGKQVEDMAKYLRELSVKGELTPEGERRVTAALQTLHELVVTN